MLLRKLRLSTRADIQRVQRSGRVSHAKHLTVKTLTHQNAEARATVVVSSKVAKSAVLRNRLRRRLRGILGELQTQLQPGTRSVVTVTRPELANIPHLQLTQILRDCLQTNGALVEKPAAESSTETTS